MGASDGGLVCFISRVRNESFKDSLLIAVCNPLMRQWKALPPHCLSRVQPVMVQLLMNRDTKVYEALVAHVKNDRSNGGYVKAKIYNSATGEWCSAKSTSSTFLGYEYEWKFDDDDDDPVLDFHRYYPCVCDPVNFHVLDPTLSKGEFVLGHALVGDRLFLLHQDMSEERDRLGEVGYQKRYSIFEYQGQKCKSNWVRVKVRSLTNFIIKCSHSDSYDIDNIDNN